MTLRIVTITTEYVEAEDRIRLAVADAAGATRVLWLTRRIAERLVPALIKGLKIESDAQEAQPFAVQAVQAAQVYAQLEARILKKPGAPVVVAAQDAQGLVHELKVRTAKGGVRVIQFHCLEQEPAELVLKPAEMRLWLEALQMGFVKGQWRLDIWPKWLQQQATANSRLKP